MLLLSTSRINRVHLRELALEGDSREDTAGDCLVVAKDHDAEAGEGPYCCVQFGAAEAPVALHREG